MSNRQHNTPQYEKSKRPGKQHNSEHKVRTHQENKARSNARHDRTSIKTCQKQNMPKKEQLPRQDSN
jgi:hypothetical protein